MTDTKESIGTLSTIVKRRTFTIESKKFPRGKIYDVTSAADFGPLEYAVLAEKQQLAQELQKKKRLTVAQKRRAAEALDDVMRLVIPTLEREVLAEMTDQQKATIVISWMVAMQEDQPGNRRARRQTARKTASRRQTGSK